MCELLNITSSHYSNIERGIADPSYELLTKFQKTFKVKDVLELFEKEKVQNGYIDSSSYFREE